MDGYLAVPDELLEYAADLAGLHERLSALADRLAAVDPAVTGHRGLTDALRDFADEWKFTVGKIGEHADATGQKLGLSARTYVDSDMTAAATIQGAVAHPAGG